MIVTLIALANLGLAYLVIKLWLQIKTQAEWIESQERAILRITKHLDGSLADDY